MPNRLLLLAAAFVLIATGAQAHAHLRSSTPAAGSALRASPAQISLSFDDELDDWKSSIALFDAQGRTVPTGRARLVGRPPYGLSAPVAGRLRPGAYKVKWQASSQDGHSAHGAFAFTVRP